MKKLIQFYYKQEQGWFLSAFLFILVSNLFGRLATLFYDSDQWGTFGYHQQTLTNGGLRLPILLTVFFSAVLFWKINRMDVSATTRTPATSTATSELNKIIAKYLVSYVEIAVLFFIEGTFLFFLSDYSFKLTNMLVFFIVLAEIIFSLVTYFIFLPQIMKYYTSGVTNIFTKFLYGTILLLAFCINSIFRTAFLNTFEPFVIFDYSFYPIASLVHLLVNLGIIWWYLKQKNGNKKGKKYV